MNHPTQMAQCHAPVTGSSVYGPINTAQPSPLFHNGAPPSMNRPGPHITIATPETSNSFVCPPNLNGACAQSPSNGLSPSSFRSTTPIISNNLSPTNGMSPEAPSPTPSSLSGDQEGRRTGRPPEWHEQRYRQLVRAYLFSSTALKDIVRMLFITDNLNVGPEAKSKTNAAQKQLNQGLGKDPRPQRPAAKDEENKRRRLRIRYDPRKRTTRHCYRTSTFPSPPNVQLQHSQTIIDHLKRTVSTVSTRSIELFFKNKTMTVKTWRNTPAASPVQGGNSNITYPLITVDTAGLVLVPGDLLRIDSENTDTRGTSRHEESISYRALTLEMGGSPNLWVGSNGLTIMARNTLNRLGSNRSTFDLSVTDSFGNTFLHFLAARPDGQGELLQLLKERHWETCWPYLGHKNTAGQTFLHVVSSGWFTNPDAPPFTDLLLLIEGLLGNEIVARLLSSRDVYGRTVFHRMLSCMKDDHDKAIDLISMISYRYACQSAVFYRDAFGNQIFTDDQNLQNRGVGYLISWPQQHELGRIPTRTHTPFQRQLADPREKYAHVVDASANQPLLEDECGRSPLHCLAELSREPIVEGSLPDKQLPKSPIAASIKGSLKLSSASFSKNRKRKAAEMDTPSPGGCSSSPQATTPGSSSTMSQDPYLFNADKVRELIVKHKCSPTAYDRLGNTALMVFIDALKDHDVNQLGPILQTLIDATKEEGLLDARNRQGETALVVAARLGKKTAVRKLVAAGANCHVRDLNGKGLLTLLNERLSQTKHAQYKYATIEAAFAALARKDGEEIGMDEDPVLRPDVFDEWGLEGRVKMGTVGGDITGS